MRLFDKSSLRVLVCGGRDYNDRRHVFATLDRIHKAEPINLIINGGADGADALSSSWARKRCVPLLVFFADWEQQGKAAGAIRNGRMLKEADPSMVVAFPGGRGTTDMVRRAKEAGVFIDDSRT